ncbi:MULTISPECIES: ATP-binding protein [unclassified Fusibacter]|uniref:ATP-binding protein n=1 Tax=unclassified Fusibacter TaxID=2624464 RepID=UPI001011F296|nr:MULTISPECIES: ATP-binding protein [unclassified Fusibacter]MCK8058862.1 ATP-binding protein [Fusibacter sp. A2]NPE21937.1 PAS domain S-box protein [Fusibacter sp. A1]RXV61506.1 PAS domain S-box protein [Fusibacter sp. A1]
MRHIANKVSLAIILSTVMMGLILGTLVYLRSEALLRAQTEENLMHVLEREASIINGRFDNVKSISNVFRSIITETIDLNRAKNEPGYMMAYKNQIIPIVENMIATFESRSGWILFNSNVIPGTNTVSFTREDNKFLREEEYDVISAGYGSEDWWMNAILYGEFWTKPYYWEPWDSEIISYSIPIRMNGDVIAVTGAELFLDTFTEQLDSISFYESGKASLLTEDMKWIYLSDSNSYTIDDLWIKEHSSIIKSKPTGIEYGLEDKTRTVLAWTTLDNGWILMAHPTYKDMFSGLKVLFNLTLITMAMSIPVTIVIGLLLSKTITKRIAVLSDIAGNILDHEKLILLPVESTDEIGHLTEVFNQMQLNVRSTLSKLRLSESKYRSLIETSDHLIYTISLDRKFLMVNKAMEDFLGIERTDLIGQAFEVLFSKDKDQKFWSDSFNDVITSAVGITSISVVVLESGEEKRLSTTLTPIFDENDTIAMVMGTSTDITQIVEAEHEINRLLQKEKEDLSDRVDRKVVELNNAMQELMEAEKMASLGRLVAGVAHEINTPLGTAITAASFLEDTQHQLNAALESGTLSKSSFEHGIEVMNDAISSINRNLQKAATLVSSFKSISVNQSHDTLTTFSIKELIEVELVSLRHEYKRLQPRITIICSSELKLKSYPGAFTQILTNLIMNSLKHGFIDIEVPGLTIVVSDERDTVTIVYKDNGVGMRQDVLSHVFEPFFTTARGKGGSGLGLNIVYNMVTGLLKGKIICESDYLKGTTFTITVPKHL